MVSIKLVLILMIHIKQVYPERLLGKRLTLD